MPRPRLLGLLAGRWDHRLVTVVAGPGFGKTMVLAAATAVPNAAGRDVWLTCESADESADHLASGLAHALGLPGDGGVDVLCNAVWALAPETVCLVLDDVHEIPASSGGAMLLGRLLDELPGNGRLLLASRAPVPVPTARLAASGQLVRVGEADLAFDPTELEEFARARGVEPELVASSGQWPALAELTAVAGADLVLDYLWEEVLGRLGAERTALLARLAAVGGGDDALVSALAGHPTTIAETLDSVPLVLRNEDGWGALHPLWTPALRRVLTPSDADAARRAAAAVHRDHGRYKEAVDLFAEAQAWDDVLAVLAEVERQPWMAVLPADLARWCRLLPGTRQRDSAVVFAQALGLEATDPVQAAVAFEQAASSFRAAGDTERELLAIAHQGFIHWWAGDVAKMLMIFSRLDELAAAGSRTANSMNAIVLAGIAHLGGDSVGVHRHLADFDGHPVPEWQAVACWLRSVAYRREGDLDNARSALDGTTNLGRNLLQEQLARLRVDWLDGEGDRVCAGLATLAEDYERSGERVFARDALLELAAKTAWRGDLDGTRNLLARADAIVLADVHSFHDTMRLIAVAGLRVAEGDEAGAATLLSDDASAAVEGPASWYWRDRAAISLVYVLVPATRAALAAQRLSATHRPGVELAEALVAAREGDLGPVRELAWPRPGVVRTHLPARWVAELAGASVIAGNPPPEELTPSAPHPPLRIRVLGMMQIERAGERVAHRDLRRRRVLELLSYLVAHGEVRRERVAAELWPELDDGGRNLRVTLTYLQKVLQPDRPEGEAPYFLRASGQTLRLAAVAELGVDVWDLEALLDEAAEAERAGTPARAVVAYRAALDLWNGEPFADLPDAPWLAPVRTRLQLRLTAAATRAGDLLLAAGATADANGVARRALMVDPFCEPAHALRIRTCLAVGDRAGALAALSECRSALADLGVEPDRRTLALLD